MTVREYIVALQQLPQEADVVISDDHQYRDPYPIETDHVHRDPDGGEIWMHYSPGCEYCVKGWPLVQVVVL